MRNLRNLSVRFLLLLAALACSYVARSEPRSLENKGVLQSAAQETSSWVRTVETARPALAVIETEKGQGSGFFIKSDGTLVTNHHVIEGAQEIQEKLPSSQTA